MSEQSSIVDLDSIQWTQAKSKNGVAFEYGALKNSSIGDETSPEDDSKAAAAADPIVFHVNWTVGGKEWVDTDGDIAPYISKYSLHIDSWNPIFDWMLQVKGLKGDYHFIDKTNDSYPLWISNPNDTHVVRYNSSKPTIVTVDFTAAY